MRGIIIGVLVAALIIAIIVFLWPAIMAALGAALGYWALRQFMIANSTGEKILYGVLIGVGALIILSNLHGVLTVAIVVALIYFLTKNKRKTTNTNTFDY
ncbi:hypothetical protein BMT55_05855 [Listeria newyorkensis]|uniref:Lia operon protein LiaI n=1 Tax=Listeria newyorkensis TaxID=1497681 RepID=A0A841YYE3_9LIST|nr:MULTISPECIES: hypothetical protein [Listeria]KGL44715.1 hypothetical protein EP56_03965 [Listeriaceae bacterium FSL A5-0209]KGL46424.1 hypothetical protein EP58_01260 [Listeria newyorkensis]KMT63084.1 hypothetical protein X559_0540 [Listeria newyorkensis]MBC1457576.1 hypothetical protein [Listeria newyorkensis]PNP92957.1 hypothetical protein BMT55_05855 [Listeria newyorkensis]